MAIVPKRKVERAPRVDTLIKPITFAIIGMFIYQVMKGVSMDIPRIDTSDVELLRNVILEPSSRSTHYVVLCHSDSGEEDAKSAKPISSVFLDSYANGGFDPNSSKIVLNYFFSLFDGLSQFIDFLEIDLTS